MVGSKSAADEVNQNMLIKSHSSSPLFSVPVCSSTYCRRCSNATKLLSWVPQNKFRIATSYIMLSHREMMYKSAKEMQHEKENDSTNM